MKERPILFSGVMVRAIRDGRKTQTRRVVNPQPVSFDDFDNLGDGESIWDGEHVIRCPYGYQGDRLWVRETFCCKLDSGTFIYRPDGHHECHYAADGYEVTKDDGDGGTEYRKDGRQASPWQPSIFMPRWASRITLEVVSVRVERVQHISEEDSISEGVTWRSCEDFKPVCIVGPYGLCSGPARIAYKELWDSINAKRGHGWSVNPWVWVIEFRDVSGKV